MSTSNIRAGRAYVEITADTSLLKQNLNKAQGLLQNFGSVCTSIGKDLLMLSSAMAAPFAISTKTFAAFDDRMRMVQAVTRATGKEFEELTHTAQRLGRETSFTAQQVADAMISLGRMGFSSQEINNSISSVLNLSRATGTDLAEAADIAANSMRIFGISSSQMSDVVDVLTATANGSAQTLNDLFEALKMAGPQASAAGESMRDVSAALGVLANVGIKGSLAGTALRKSFSRFANVDVQETLADVGVTAVDAEGNLRKMADIMRDVAVVMNNMPTAQRLAFAEEIFDIRGSLAGLSLGGNIQGLDEFLNKLKDVENVASNTASAMDAGIGGSFRLLLSAVEGVMNAIGAALNSTLQPMVDKITTVVGSFAKWIEANAKLVTVIAASVSILAIMGSLLIVVGMAAKGLASIIAITKGAMTAFNFVVGSLIGQGSTLRTTISLITQAFTNYSNASIPALVGTSQLLATLRLPLDSRANQIAASFILMSRAETALAARSILATKYAALCAILKKLTLGNIAATVAAKAHAASLGILSLGTRTLASVQKVAVAISGMFSLSNLRVAATSVAASVANNALAISSKLVAGGFLAASAAAKAFCALPIALIVVAIVGAIVGLVRHMVKANTYTAELSENMQKLREDGDAVRQTDQLRMQRLEQLAQTQSLNNEEMAEATKLTNMLQGKYGNLGIEIDGVSKSLSMASDAQKRFNAAMRQSTMAQIQAEIAELTHNISELEKENESLTGFWSNFGAVVSTFDTKTNSNKISENFDEMRVLMEKRRAARLRLHALEGGDDNASTNRGEDEVLQERIQRYNSRIQVNKDEYIEAQRRASEIEKQLSREKQRELEREIHDIETLRDEYLELLEVMIDFEKGKKNVNEKRVSELESKYEQAIVDAEERIQKAQDKVRIELELEVKGLQKEFDETISDITKRREQAKTDKTIEQTLATDKSQGLKLLGSLLQKASQAAMAARSEFATALANAKADGVISEDENSNLSRIQESYISAEALVDKYREKLDSAQKGTSNAEKRSNNDYIGSFYAHIVAALNGRGTQEIRMLKAQEQVAANTKRTNELLRQNKAVFV